MASITFKFKKNPMQVFQWTHLDVSINNEEPIKVSWSKPTALELEPGAYSFHMSFQYMGKACGKADAQLDILEDENYVLTYKPPLTMFSGGKVQVSRA